LDTVVISHDVIVGMTCEESGRHIHVGLPHHLLCVGRARCLASLVVTPGGYKSRHERFLGLREHCFSFPLTFIVDHGWAPTQVMQAL
jgi:hypothetical protein